MGLVRRTATDAPPPEAASPEDLIGELSSSDPEGRRRAALGLGGDAGSLDRAVQALLIRVGDEQEPTVRDAVLTTLAATDRDDVAEGLVSHLSSDDAGLRTAVAEALAAMPGAVPHVIPELLASPDHDVRIMTAMVLADLPHHAAVDWLVRMVEEDSHPNVVSAAIDALLPLAEEEHVPVLRRAAERFPDNPFLRFTVEAALPRLIGSSA